MDKSNIIGISSEGKFIRAQLDTSDSITIQDVIEFLEQEEFEARGYDKSKSYRADRFAEASRILKSLINHIVSGETLRISIRAMIDPKDWTGIEGGNDNG